MNLARRFTMIFQKSKNVFVPILSKQTDYINQAAGMLLSMFDVANPALWPGIEREIKSYENKSDALLTEFHEVLTGRLLIQVNRLDLQAVSMAMDDCLDVIKDTAKGLIIYAPARLDDQLREIAQMACDQSAAVHSMIPLLADIRKNLSSILLLCDRVTEIEHAADEAYEEYIGYIFSNIKDVRELIKYKNLAEMLENETDSFKRIADCVRKLLLNCIAR
jgi:Phosphate transport regulator (distant homolog of PhoU)